MIISNDSLSEYQKDLNKLTDSLTSLYLDENHKDINESEALKLAHKIINDLSKEQGLIIPNEESLVSKMINELNKYNDSLIELPRKIVVSSKNSLINSVKTNSDNQFEVDINSLVLENTKNLKGLDDKEEKHVNAGKIIDNIITHINFKNCNNLEYAKIEHEVEKIVEKNINEFIPTYEDTLKTSVNHIKNNIGNTISNFNSFINSQNEKAKESTIMTGAFFEDEKSKQNTNKGSLMTGAFFEDEKKNIISNMSEEEKNNLVFGSQNENEFSSKTK